MLFKKVLLLLCVIVTIAGTACAENLTVPQELASYGAQVYSEAKSYFGRSFSGYCGTYVRCQLRAMGIFDNKFDFRGNGNQWYSNFENVEMTSGGYYVYRESGGDCLTKISEKYGNNLENIVLSFPIQSGHSASNPGAGHALVIYRLQDGVAYYSESFSFGNNREGTVMAENAEDLVTRYSRRHGSPIGCVLLSKTEIGSDSKGIVVDDGNNIIFADLSVEKQIEQSLNDISDVDFFAKRFIEFGSTDIQA